MLLPSFSVASLNDRAIPILTTSIDRLFSVWSSPALSSELDVERSLSLLTKEIMLRFVFGTDLNVLEHEGGTEGEQVVKWVEVIFDVCRFFLCVLIFAIRC